MAKTYIVRAGDTLSAIAQKSYNDAGLAQKLADYNGLRDVNRLMVRQHLEIPSRVELLGRAPTNSNPAVALATPSGLPEIVSTFGNIFDFIAPDGSLDSTWQTTALAASKLPFPLTLSWDHTKTVSRFQCHKLLTGIFEAVFAEIQAQSLPAKVTSYGGCFAYRAKRTSAKLSTHSWGIAIDLNPETNAQGSTGSMDPAVVTIFQSHGFKWGGDWTGKSRDPMHFQFCTGY